ncbi:hypothetical protein EB796_012706 [Bugula neritina]|uniref:Uncharacterized protein n=1 Tax=Bugula neritina TaxID=10212 RepID=A0A7J7JUA0_BUGNE|nr:hypothetical protein EB796_012706 [Bugula neritina]
MAEQCPREQVLLINMQSISMLPLRLLLLFGVANGFAVYNSKSPKYSWYSEAVSANITVRVNEDFVSSDKDLRICYSDLPETFPDGNTTIVEVLGYFACPFKDSNAPTDTYCCGPANRQQCCGFWDDATRYTTAGLGVMLGAVGALILICWILYKCFSHKTEIKCYCIKVYAKGKEFAKQISYSIL